MNVSVVRRARKDRRGCHRIRAGELYVRHVEFPGGESGYADAAGHPVAMDECGDCATRYGRGPMITEYVMKHGSGK